MRNQEWMPQLKKSTERKMICRFKLNMYMFFLSNIPLFLLFFNSLMVWLYYFLFHYNFCNEIWHAVYILSKYIQNMKKWKYSDFHTDWFPSLRMWYYFRLCFSFSCSGYKLTVIKKAKHFTFCFTHSLLATVVGPCTTKTTNSRKAVHVIH